MAGDAMVVKGQAATPAGGIVVTAAGTPSSTAGPSSYVWNPAAALDNINMPFIKAHPFAAIAIGESGQGTPSWVPANRVLTHAASVHDSWQRARLGWLTQRGKAYVDRC